MQEKKKKKKKKAKRKARKQGKDGEAWLARSLVRTASEEFGDAGEPVDQEDTSSRLNPSSKVVSTCSDGLRRKGPWWGTPALLL